MNRATWYSEPASTTSGRCLRPARRRRKARRRRRARRRAIADCLEFGGSLCCCLTTASGARPPGFQNWRERGSEGRETARSFGRRGPAGQRGPGVTRVGEVGWALRLSRRGESDAGRDLLRVPEDGPTIAPAVSCHPRITKVLAPLDPRDRLSFIPKRAPPVNSEGAVCANFWGRRGSSPNGPCRESRGRGRARSLALRLRSSRAHHLRAAPVCEVRA